VFRNPELQQTKDVQPGANVLVVVLALFVLRPLRISQHRRLATV